MVRSNILRKGLIASGIVMNLLRVVIIPADNIVERPISEPIEVLPPIVTSIKAPAPVPATESRVPMTESVSDELVIEEPEPGTHDKRFDEIRQILEKIPTGQAMLNAIETSEVSVSFKAGQGSHFAYWANHINVDGDSEDLAAALLLVHEATHAMYYNQGWTPNPKLLTREEYTAAMAEEEAEAEINVVQAKIELESTGVGVTEVSSIFEMDFRTTYRETVEWEMMTNRQATEEEREAIAREAGKSKIIEGYIKGKVVSSTQGTSYPQIWGKTWDTADAQSDRGDEIYLYLATSPDLMSV